MSGHTSHGDLSHQLGHILPVRLYITIFVVLLVLTAVTVGAAYFDFGQWNLVIAMAIASCKALAVALFFMHLKYENPLTWLYAAFPVILLAFLIGGVFLDNGTRIDARTMESVNYPALAAELHK